jgi:hypothetical protein
MQSSNQYHKLIDIPTRRYSFTGKHSPAESIESKCRKFRHHAIIKFFQQFSVAQYITITLITLLFIVFTYLHYFPIYQGWRVAPHHGPTLYDYNIDPSIAKPNHIRRITENDDISALRKSAADTDNKLIIITACNDNHFESLQYMLYSLRELHATLIFYDLGLTDQQRAELITWNGFHHRYLDFNQYPSHVNISIQAGQYAWKPIILHEVMTEQQDSKVPVNDNSISTLPYILWIDAGAYFLDTEMIRNQIAAASSGVYIGRSWGTVSKKTHPAMYDWFHEDIGLYADKGNCEAGMIGFHNTAFVLNTVIKPWKDCAMDKACIAPRGSSRKNHRQDQSALTYLLHKNHIPILDQSERIYYQDGVKTKCDRNFYGIIPTYPSVRTYAYFCLV